MKMFKNRQVLTIGWFFWLFILAFVLLPITVEAGEKATTITNPDGSITTTYPGGTKITEWSGGFTITEKPDGTKITEWPGTGKITENPDGTKIRKFPDGTRITEEPNGKKTTGKPDGTFITEYPNGTKITWTHDGTRITEYKDGYVTKITEKFREGTKITEYKDGTKITEFEDGDVARIIEKDGTKVTYFRDGRKVTESKEDIVEKPKEATKPEEWKGVAKGVVTDKVTGKPVEEGTVTLISKDKPDEPPRHAKTTGAGEYEIPNVPPGKYTAVAKGKCHQKVVQDIVVGQGTTNINFQPESKTMQAVVATPADALGEASRNTPAVFVRTVLYEYVKDQISQQLQAMGINPDNVDLDSTLAGIMDNTQWIGEFLVTNVNNIVFKEGSLPLCADELTTKLAETGKDKPTTKTAKTETGEGKLTTETKTAEPPMDEKE